MKNNLNITLVQTDTVWKNIDQNLKNLTKKINDISNETDVIILPELFSTGFTMKGENLAETMDGKSVQWMKEISNKMECLVIGSLIINDNSSIYNRLIVSFPPDSHRDGEVKYYDKRHLFSFAGEDKVFSSGETKLVFDYKGFKICPLVCYDLRFPVWARNTEEIDLLIYVANWPVARIQSWDILLKARAIENLCYSIGVNRVGVDNNNLVYNGHSAAYDTLGNVLTDFEEGKEGIKTIRLDKEYILKTRNKFGFLEDRDSFEIN